MGLLPRVPGELELRSGPGFQLPTGRTVLVGACLVALAHLNNLEVLFLLLTRFRRWSGLYFWTVAIAAISSTMFTIGITFLELVPDRSSLLPGSILSTTGFMLYEPAEFLLVYSRLHLISASRRTQKCVLALIIAYTLLLTIPTGVTVVGDWLESGGRFHTISAIILKVKVCAYTAMEFLFSSIFLYQVAKAWNRRTQPQIIPVLGHILVANLIIICMHSGAITLDYLGFSMIHLSWAVSYLHPTELLRHTINNNPEQTFLYAYQLKLEFWILNELTELSQSNLSRSIEIFGLDDSATTTVTSATASAITSVEKENDSDISTAKPKRRLTPQFYHGSRQQEQEQAVT
jgi:hypothetical protein